MFDVIEVDLFNEIDGVNREIFVELGTNFYG